MLLGVGYEISENIKEQALKNQQPVDYFPEGVGVFLKLNDFSKTIDHFMETSMIWSSLESETSSSTTNKMVSGINELVGDELLNNIFNNGETYVALYPDDSVFNWVITKNIGINISDSILSENTFLNSSHYYIQEPFLIIGDNKDILSKISINIKNNSKEGKWNFEQDEIVK